MGLALCGAAAQAQEKPNFLIIQCDHLTQRVVGAYGHTPVSYTHLPFGMTGKKKISDYLTDRKFSISQKERQWVLCCGEHIAWPVSYTHLDVYKSQVADSTEQR